MTQSEELAPSDGMSEGFFGESVAASGPAVLVGASGTDTAYVYKYNSNRFTGFRRFYRHWGFLRLARRVLRSGKEISRPVFTDNPPTSNPAG
jgi:FG-GAP repeat